MDGYLEHYGVKGMKWGVRKDREYTKKDKQAFEDFIKKQQTAPMGGPQPDIKKEPFYKKLTPAQKRAILIFGTTAVVAGAIYGAHHYGLLDSGAESLPKLLPVGSIDAASLLTNDNSYEEYLEFNASVLKGTGSLALGMEAYKTNGISLPEGTIVSRISTQIEKVPRPNGFYAAHEYHDIESYKVFLGSPGSVINHFKATKEIKIPSTEKYVEALAKAMDHPEVLRAKDINLESLDALSVHDRFRALTKLAEREIAYYAFPYSLNSSTIDGLLPQRFVKEILGSGYTSVVDYNNTSSFVAKAPVRHLDGSMFSFLSSEKMSPEAYDLAVKNVDDNLDKIAEFYDTIKHSIFGVIGKALVIGGFSMDGHLKHYGVKGMKWGVRKDRSKREERARAARKDVKNRRRTISDETLNRQIDRLQKEKKLKDLVNEDLRPGRTIAQRIMSDSGQKVARNAFTGTLTFFVGAAVAKFFGDRFPGLDDMVKRGGVKKK